MKNSLPLPASIRAVIIFEWYWKNNYARCRWSALVLRDGAWYPCVMRDASSNTNDIPIHRQFTRWGGRLAPGVTDRDPGVDASFPLSLLSKGFGIQKTETMLLFNNSVRQCLICGLGEETELILPEGWKLFHWLDAPVNITPLLECSWDSHIKYFLCERCLKDVRRQVHGPLTWKNIIRAQSLMPEHQWHGRFHKLYQTLWPQKPRKNPAPRAAARHVRKLIRTGHWPAVTESTRRFFQTIIGIRNLEKLTTHPNERQSTRPHPH